MVQDDGPVGLDGLRVEFDDERVVSDAGVMLVATVAQRLGVEALAGQLVRLRRDRPGAANVGRNVMAVLFAMVLGADSIDDCGVLRAGRTRRLLGGWLPAPSTLGTFLRAFTFGHVRQLDALLGRALERAWAAGAGPGDGRLVIDVDSFVGEVSGRLKQGAAYGYTRLLGYHPILATRAAIEEDSRQRIDYPDDGEAQIAETVYGGRRLIVRRTRLLGPQAELWPDWRHFALITNPRPASRTGSRRRHSRRPDRSWPSPTQQKLPGSWRTSSRI
jgi:hypothetical protein